MTVYTLANFFEQLPINEFTLGLSENVQTSRSVGGLTYRAARGPRIWGGTISCANSKHWQGRKYQALINEIQKPGNYFMVTPLELGRAIRPANWVSGNVFSGVKVDGTQTIGNSLKIKGCPANFQFIAGDYFSLTLGVQRLFQITSDAQADADGKVTLSTNIPFTIGRVPVNDQAVSFMNPTFLAAYVDGSYSNIKTAMSHSEGFSFGFQQVFRT